MNSAPRQRGTFGDFYRHVFLPEHQHPVNRVLHVFGTLAGLAYIVCILMLPVWPNWIALAFFPIIHAAPGLLGHRWLERNQDVGDLRWRRTDFPTWWFIVGNHRLAAEIALSLLRELTRSMR
jgi:hypothetical protein